MKKQFIVSFVLMLGIGQNAFSQTVIPHDIPCFDITPDNLDTLPSGIAAADCITADGATIDFNADQNYSIRAGEYIQFDENTVIIPDASHTFHAYIQKEDLDLAWYYPNATPGTVGRYEKLEIGAHFVDTTIQNKIENFVKNRAGDKLNPFNPEEIDIYAEFWRLNVDLFGGETWIGPRRVNGFYYEEFMRSTDTIHWDTIPNSDNFRFRFAPPVYGTWRCKVSAVVAGYGTLTVSEFTFDCVASDNKGYMKVGENTRYFEIGGEPFFPVGHNLMSPQNAAKNVDYTPRVVEAYGYIDYARRLRKLKESGANYFRYIVCPWQTEIEYEHLGNYSNRMTNAWEFDRILDTTKALGLKMHLNMTVHYNFEVPSGLGKYYWDWSAAGDTLNTPVTPWGEDGCFRDIDSGYCYRKDLDMPSPRDFFSDSTAFSYYKKRARYMEARWGYSTEIAVKELLSEASLVALYKQKEICTGIADSTYLPYEHDPTTFPQEMYLWHKKYAEYLKNSLKSNQLISVNYAGEPNMAYGDNSYAIPEVDIMTFNNYQLAINTMETMATTVTKYQRSIYDEPSGVFAIHKPFMNSEYGTNTGTYLCDQNASFIQRLCVGPLTGLAASPLTWDSQWDEQEGWHYYQNINDLMTGIQLDNENWFAGESQVQNDKSVEMFYLRKGELGENTKIVGVISNRTFNYWTQGIGYPCDSGAYNPTPNIYDNELNLDVSDLAQDIKFKEMGVFKGYQIEWINALTGEAIETTEKISDGLGHLKLEFPGTLTGNSSRPILFFKLYRTDATFLAPIIPDENQAGLPDDFLIDNNVSSIEPTDWSLLTKDNFEIILSPNPTDGIVNINITGCNGESCAWQISDGNGRVMDKGNTTSPNFTVDLSVYAKGVYYLEVNSLTNQVQTKIIKL